MYAYFSPEDWTATGTVANAVIVLALAVINFFYMRSAKRQADSANAQAEQSRRQADAALESLRLLKAQMEKTEKRDLLHAILALRGIRYSLNYWKPFVTDQWGMMPDKSPQLLPLDWAFVAQIVNRDAPNLRDDALLLEQVLSNAEYQIKMFQSKPPNYRDASLMPLARTNLQSSTPPLNKLLNHLEAREREPIQPVISPSAS